MPSNSGPAVIGRGPVVFESSSVRSVVLGGAEQYRVRAQNYRAWAATETDRNRREVFDLLADTFERLASDYERAGSSRD